MSIDVNYGHIADVSIKSFADLSSPSVAQKATIQVNKNTFSVSIREDGRVDVSFKGFKFMYLFRGYTKTRLRNQIEAQINDWRTAIAKPSRQAVTDKIGANTEKAFSETFGYNLDGQVDANRAEVAVYGFSDVRRLNAPSAERHNIQYSMIDNYNRGIGIRPQAVTADNLQQHLRNISNGTCQISNNLLGLSRNKAELWMNFLARPENLARIDIFSRLKTYVRIGNEQKPEDKLLTGWKGVFANKGRDAGLKEFVRKNIPGDMRQFSYTKTSDMTYVQEPYTDEHIEVIARTLKILVEKCPDNVNRENVRKAVLGAARACGVHLTEGKLGGFIDLLDGVVACAFFRQTSKMGLEFFKENRTPVMFYWTNHQGQTISENNRTLSSKWWKNPANSVSDHYGASITYSEMRHVEKMLEKQKSGQTQNSIFGDVDPLVLLKIKGIDV